MFDPANGEVYVFNQGSGSVSVIDGATNTVLTTITGLPSPTAGAYDSINGKIYVANYDSGHVSIIDTSSNQLVNTIIAGNGPAGALFDPDNNKIYIANQGHVGGGPGENTLSVINGSNDSIVGSPIVIPGPSPVGLAYNPNNHNIYVTNFGSNGDPGNTVTRISTTSNIPDTIITSALDDNGAVVANGGATLSTSIHITFQGIGDNIVGFQCSLDGSTFSSCTTPFVANQLKAGVKHHFEVRAVNSFGDKDATPAVFSWFILTPQQGIERLIQLVKSMNLDHGLETSLIASLKAAEKSLSHGNNVPACNQLSAFINKVQSAAQNGQLTTSQAFKLMNSARAIQTALEC